MNVRMPDADGTHRLGVQPPENWPAMRLEYDGPRDAFVLTIQDTLGGPAHVAILDQDTVAALRAQVQEKPQPEAPDMQVQVTRRRYANMGDHAEYVTEGQTYDPLETVESLVLRVLDLRQPYLRHDAGDSITLRVVDGTQPDNTPRNAQGTAQPPL